MSFAIADLLINCLTSGLLKMPVFNRFDMWLFTGNAISLFKRLDAGMVYLRYVLTKPAGSSFACRLILSSLLR